MRVFRLFLALSVFLTPLALPVSGARAQACGGDLPPCSTMHNESRGNPNAINPSGCGGRGCYGKWQFDPNTSAGLGYDRPMNEYPESVQDEAARRLWDGGAGCDAWKACGGGQPKATVKAVPVRPAPVATPRPTRVAVAG